MTDDAQKLLNETVNLDPDYYENEILKHTTSQGLFKVPFGPVNNPNLGMALTRLLVADCVTLMDLTVEPTVHRVPTPDGKGVNEFQPMTLKIFKLTEKGFRRQRQLAIKFRQ